MADWPDWVVHLGLVRSVDHAHFDRKDFLTSTYPSPSGPYMAPTAGAGSLGQRISPMVSTKSRSDGAQESREFTGDSPESQEGSVAPQSRALCGAWVNRKVASSISGWVTTQR